MATPIVPKSSIRQCRSVIVGFGEVPAVTKEGQQGWGLPGRGVTFCVKEATKWAKALDRVIRDNLNNPKRVTLI